MKLILEKAAVKSLRKMQPKTAAALLASLKSVAAAPFDSHPNCKRLQGGDNDYRLRHGDWRALYHLDQTEQTMIVTEIEPRGGVYK
jgi:mRNA interferase RelE/StbE